MYSIYHLEGNLNEIFTFKEKISKCEVRDITSEE